MQVAKRHNNQTVAVATHANPIKAVQSIARTGNVEAMETIPWVSNASVTIITYNNEGWTLVAESLDGHLSELKTALPENV